MRYSISNLAYQYIILHFSVWSSGQVAKGPAWQLLRRETSFNWMCRSWKCVKHCKLQIYLTIQFSAPFTASKDSQCKRHVQPPSWFCGLWICRIYDTLDFGHTLLLLPWSRRLGFSLWSAETWPSVEEAILAGFPGANQIKRTRDSAGIETIVY